MMEWWNAFNDMISSAKEYSLVMLKSYWVNVGTSEIDLCGNQKVCKLYYRTTTLDFMLGAKVKHKSPRSGGISPLSLLRDDMKLKKIAKILALGGIEPPSERPQRYVLPLHHSTGLKLA
jgi:hypothetical protein